MDRNTARPGALRGQVSQPHVSTPSPAPTHQPARQGRGRKKLWLAVAIALLIVGLMICMYLWKGAGMKEPASDRYQAVFMNNGQVFFGKLKNVNGTYLKLERAFYTKKQDVPATATDEQKKAIENNISLVKVGDEVYGPENIMMIRSDQVLFWQDLKGDSKVAKAIDDAK